jgi:putative NIF3 family GTP cyclohydrolase 1 type 2
MQAKKMKIKDIAAAIEKIAALKLAQDWDNVGLLIGDAQRNVKNILLTIDVTDDVVTEAKRLKTDLIISRDLGRPETNHPRRPCRCRL